MEEPRFIQAGKEKEKHGEEYGDEMVAPVTYLLQLGLQIHSVMNSSTVKVITTSVT